MHNKHSIIIKEYIKDYDILGHSFKNSCKKQLGDMVVSISEMKVCLKQLLEMLEKTIEHTKPSEDDEEDEDVELEEPEFPFIVNKIIKFHKTVSDLLATIKRDIETSADAMQEDKSLEFKTKFLIATASRISEDFSQQKAKKFFDETLKLKKEIKKTESIVIELVDNIEKIEKAKINGIKESVSMMKSISDSEDILNFDLKVYLDKILSDVNKLTESLNKLFAKIIALTQDGFIKRRVKKINKNKIKIDMQTANLLEIYSNYRIKLKKRSHDALVRLYSS